MIPWFERLALPSISVLATGLVTAAVVEVPVKVHLDSRRFEHVQELAYQTPLKYPWPWTGMTDGSDDRRAAGTRLIEDGSRLGPPHVAHARVRSLGSGRFSHWGGRLVFSSSDGSDPRTNGRLYTAVLSARLAPAFLRKALLALALASVLPGLLWLRAGRISRSELAIPAALWSGSWLALRLATRSHGVALWLVLGLASVLLLWASATTRRIHLKGCGRAFAGFRRAPQWTLAAATLFLALAAAETYLLARERRALDQPAGPRLVSADLAPAHAPSATLTVSDTPEAALERALRKFGVEISRQQLLAVARRSALVTLPPELERRPAEVEGAAQASFWHGALHVSNRDGFRRSTPFPPRRADTFRVMVVGDSLTYGFGIEESATYARLLETRLRSTHRTEVLNLGIPGAQSEDVLAITAAFLPRLEPDLVIYGVCLNDFLPSGVGQYRNNLAYPFPLPGLLKEFLLERTRLARLATDGYDRLLLAAGLRLDFYGDILKRFSDYQKRFARDVARLNAVVVERGLPPVVAMVLTQGPRVGSRGHRIAQDAERHLLAAGADLIAIEPYFRHFDGINFRVSRWEGHPNEVANAIWAEMLRRHLAAMPALAAYRRSESELN